MTCTGCPHLPHRHACVAEDCRCGVVTLDDPRAILELLAARTEYLVGIVLDGNEHMKQVAAEQRRVRAALERHTDEEESRLGRLEAQVAHLVKKLGNGAAEASE